uniref:(northern house mosquito) hypothetical protein n=1 Tax=Culex pipiens TaxID=7175 RepID=A0A8D8GIE4_CULPI
MDVGYQQDHLLELVQDEVVDYLRCDSHDLRRLHERRQQLALQASDQPAARLLASAAVPGVAVRVHVLHDVLQVDHVHGRHRGGSPEAGLCPIGSHPIHQHDAVQESRTAGNLQGVHVREPGICPNHLHLLGTALHPVAAAGQASVHHGNSQEASPG